VFIVFGLVFSGLVGVDVGVLFDDVEVVIDVLVDDVEGNLVFVFGVVFVGVVFCVVDGCCDKVVFVLDGIVFSGFLDWVE